MVRSVAKHRSDIRSSDFDARIDENETGSSSGMKLSRSCPRLVDLESTSNELKANADVRSSTNQQLKSHPLIDVGKKAKRKDKGISIVKLFNVMSIGLGSVVSYVGWKWKILRLRLSVVGGFCFGMYSGLRCCKNYQRNLLMKYTNQEILRLPLSESGAFQIGSASENYDLSSANPVSEKVDYITRVLKLMWPYYEPNICKWIVDFLNPTLEEVKPPIIRRICLSGLTFGSIPFDITEVAVVKESNEEFVIDAGVRWHGNANVSLAIDLRGGSVLTPRFQKFNFYGTIRISFTPLIPHFPGFGAMTLSFQSTPTIDFELSVGQSVLSVVAEQVRQFLSSFVTDHVFGNVLVWPARVVIPILPERRRGKLDHLQLHTRGVLRVVVVEASGLAFGESTNGFRTNIKPFVVLETVGLQLRTTKVLPDGHMPIWNEEHYLKVQELDQSLKVEVFDDHYDPVLSAFSTLKRHGRKIGSISIPLKDLEPGRTKDAWYKLAGIEEDMTRAVRSKHYGQDMLSEMWYLDKRSCTQIQIRLKLTYMPVEDLRQGRLLMRDRKLGTSTNSHHGLLFVRLLRAYNLANVDFLSLSDPFCQLTVGTRPPKRSRTIKNTLDPKWGESFEWFNVSTQDRLYIEVLSEGKVVDLPIGYVNIGILAIAFDCAKGIKTIEATFTLIDGVGDIHLEIEWVPLDSNPFRKKQLRNLPDISGPIFKAAPRGQLFLRLLWAVGLENVDYLGMSDPYCLMKIQGNERKSAVVWDNLKIPRNGTRILCLQFRGVSMISQLEILWELFKKPMSYLGGSLEKNQVSESSSSIERLSYPIGRSFFYQSWTRLANRQIYSREDIHERALYSFKMTYPLSDEQAMQIIEEDLPTTRSMFSYIFQEGASCSCLSWAMKVPKTNVAPVIYQGIVSSNRSIASLFDKLSQERLGCNAQLIVDEFGEKLLEELDYLQEARNIAEFRKNFANDPTVKIPWVRPELSNRRVLVMEWIDGVRCTDPENIQKNIKVSEFVKYGVRSGLRQLLEFGLFHGDPHPGNIFALQDGRIAYVDFGNVAQLSQANKQILVDAVVHAVNEDYVNMAGDFIKLGFLSPGTDTTPIIPALEKIWKDSLGQSMAVFNFRTVTSKFNELVYQYPIRIPERYSLVIRSLLTQEGICMTLDPSFHFLEVAYPYVARRLLTDEDPALRERLIQVLFQDGKFQWKRLENLIALAKEGTGGGGSLDLNGTIKDAVRLFLMDPKLRQQVIDAFTEDDKLHLEEVGSLLEIIGPDFDAQQIVSETLADLPQLSIRLANEWSDQVLAS
eukprot:g6827.t1